jgi:hypothetical protein
MEFLSGIESTYIFGTGQDVLDLSDHTRRFRADLELARGAGLRTLRYPFPWNKIERVRGVYDWRWIDQAVRAADELGVELIGDLLHHTSFPDWLTHGFLQPGFSGLFAAFARAVAERYPHIGRHTVVNEPYVTCWFCGHEGVWHPKRKSDDAFARMMGAVAMANSLAQAAMEQVRPMEFLHTESCERHFAADEESEGRVRFANEMRFAGHDLLLGRVDRDHPLRDYFSVSPAVSYLQDYPGRIDALGLDYYLHSEIWHSKSGRIHPPSRRGFAEIAVDYADRYAADVMLAETNIRGTPSERRAHFEMMVGECRKLERNLPYAGQRFRGFCWFPFTDCRGWSNLCTRVTHDLDPQGIWSMDERNERVETEFTRAFQAAIREEASAEMLSLRDVASISGPEDPDLVESPLCSPDTTFLPAAPCSTR